jgi:hypothetical protein
MVVWDPLFRKAVDEQFHEMSIPTVNVLCPSHPNPRTKLHFSPVISFRRLQTDKEHYRQQPKITEATPHGQTKNSLARHNTRFSGTDENNETNSERATQTGQVARKCC